MSSCIQETKWVADIVVEIGKSLFFLLLTKLFPLSCQDFLFHNAILI